MNSYIGEDWGKEEVLNYDVNQELNLEVTASKQGFLILLNDEFFHFYKSRLPWDTFSLIEFRDGDEKTDKPIWKVEDDEIKPD